MKITAVTLYILVTILVQTFANEIIVEEIRKCNFSVIRDQQDLNNCLFNVLDMMREEILKGNRVFDSPNLEPINLANFTFVQGEGPVQITSEFRNFLVHGFTNYTITHFEVLPQQNKITVGIFIPDLFVEGQYTLSGNALLLKVEGDGDMWSKVKNLDGIVSSTIVIKTENGIKRLGITNTEVDFTIEGSTTNLSNLFDGDPILGETIHHFINNNNFYILEGIQPLINAEISKYLQAIIDPMFAKIPVHAIFPNEPL